MDCIQIINTTAYFVIRACYINPRTSRAEVDDLAEAVGRIGDALQGEK